MMHLGDIQKLNGAKIPKVDIITFGAPCQDISIAGKRAGMKSKLMGDEENTRSGLFYDAIRIIKEMREDDRANGRSDVDIRPRYAVYENVPGAFSSNKGEDFRCVLEETAKIADSNAIIPRLKEDRNGKQKWSKAGAILGDGWSIAWRVHDAQFWGVPQRRKRISLVADFGGTTAPEILFEPKSLYGNTTQSREEGQGTTTDVEGSVGETIKCLNGWDVQSKHIQPENGIAEALYSGECRGGGGESYVMQSRVYGISSYNSNSMKSSNPHSGIYEAETTKTLDNNGENPACNQGGMAIVQGADVYNGQLTGEVAATLTNACGGSNTSGAKIVQGFDGFNLKETDEVCPTLMCQRVDTKNIPSVTYYRKKGLPQNAQQGQGWEQTETNDTLNAFDNGECRTPTVVVDMGGGKSQCGVTENVTPTLATTHGGEPVVMDNIQSIGHDLRSAKFTDDEITDPLTATDYKDPIKISYNSVVRRLTPLECERLQGFPDGWTDIGDWIDSKGKKHKGESDSPRYKALGNSIALPFWEWMAKRMVKHIDHEATMGSLFDGIGGFPLVFSRAGAKPIWASEIEEFPMAVTKIRFPDNEVKQ